MNADKRRRKLDKGSRGKRRQLQRVYARDFAVCYWCNQHVRPDDASREHIRPLCDGGSREDWNVVLAHKECNR